MTAVIEPLADEVAEHVVIDRPGVYDLSEKIYHSDPVPSGSLSYSGMKRILECPAKYAHDRRYGRRSKKEWDFGHVAHHLVLGTGLQIEVVDSPTWQPKAAKEARAAAYAVGAVPILAKDYEMAQRLASAVRAHRVAGALFDSDTGIAEQSIFWVDPNTGAWLRCRPDWMKCLDSGRLVIVDLKTCSSAEPRQLRRAIRNFGYDQQDSMYRAGVKAVGLSPEPDFLFVFVEVEPPHVITIARVDDCAREVGQRLNRKAIDLYQQYTKAGHWPGYVADDEIAEISEPGWVSYEIDEL